VAERALLAESRATNGSLVDANHRLTVGLERVRYSLGWPLPLSIAETTALTLDCFEANPFA
jgi:hypothetical protein